MFIQLLRHRISFTPTLQQTANKANICTPHRSRKKEIQNTYKYKQNSFLTEKAALM